MNNLKISTRLIALIGFLSLLLIVIGSIGLNGVSQSNTSLKSVYENNTVPTKQLADISYLVQRNRVLAMDMLLINQAANTDKRFAEMQGNVEKINQLWNAYLATSLTDEEKKLADTFVVHRKAYVGEGLLPAGQAMKEGKTDVARDIYEHKISPLAPKAQEAMNNLLHIQADLAKQEYDHAMARYATIRVISLGSIVVGLALGALMGWSLLRNISSALAEAVDVAQAVAQGDLTHPVHVSGRHEVTLVLQALKSMQDNLIKVVSTVRRNSENVSSASNEVNAGSHDLFARTEKQAASLEETASSMEELSSTVKHNADNARQASQLAQSASDVAIRGGEVVAEVVNTMKGINDSSRKINDIISVIDGIAFQTNILALNAAVEAARAGEQGRGFAVVAGEVRSLAGRSAEAAKEIKALITDSVSRVEQGTTLVDQAGHTMEEVVSSIRRVTDIMGEISAASTEQSQGVAQVSEAVTHMDQATQKNAALVEEMAAAATTLKNQAQELVQTVAVFKLDARAPQVAPSATAAPARVPSPPPAQVATRSAPKLAAPMAPKTSAPPPKSPPAKGGEEDWESF
jgi:methyl-accepting chemotaxis protein-1 (serine sensor receptor)